jgi:S1-C subfamily serine protease
MDRTLALAGLRMSRPNVPRLGIYTTVDSGGVLVNKVEEDASAAAAGVREGDYLLSIGDIPVTDEQFADKFRAKFGSAAEGSPVSLKVRRGGQVLTLTGKLRFAPGDIELAPDPAASAKAVRIRNGILKGTRG